MKIIKVKVFRVEHAWKLTNLQLKAVFARARRLLREVNLHAEFSTQDIADLPVFYHSDSPFQYPGIFLNEAMKFYPNDPDTFHHYLIKPIVIGRYQFFGGAALKVCCDKDKRHSCSSGFMSEQVLGSPIKSVAAIMAHEIAHSCGASHDNTSSSIMSDYLNMWSSHDSAKFLRKARAEVRDCLNKP